MVLGQILTDASCYLEADLQPDHFFIPAHRAIMEAIQGLYKERKPIDTLTVGDALGNRLDAVGGFAYLSELELEVVTTQNCGYYAEKIRDSWLKNQISQLPSRIEGSSGAEQLRELREQLDYLGGLTAHTPPTQKELYEQEKQSIFDDMARLDAGDPVLFGLDDGLGLSRVVPGGVPLGKLTLLFGESGNYKTTTKNNLLKGIARLNPGTHLDISLEDANKLSTQRYIASETGVNYGRIATRKLSPDDVRKVTTLSEAALAPADRILAGGEIPPNVDKIIDLARDLKRKRGLLSVTIDYIQMLDDYVYYGHQGLQRALGKLLQAAKRDNIAYILVSQVNKDVDDRSRDKKLSTRPSMEDLFGSSFLKFNSKLGIGVYRPWKYEKVPRASRRAGDPDYTTLFNDHPNGKDLYPLVLELWVNKNVLGETDVCVLCMVNPQTGKMVPCPDDIKALIV